MPTPRPDPAAHAHHPRLVVTLLVRDEIELVEANVRHHLRSGAAHVIVTDNGSVDGTRELLDVLAGELPVSVIDEPSPGYEQYAWVTRMARSAATDHGADWVINADADELWWAPDHDLPAALAPVPEHLGVVEGAQLNFAPVGDRQRPEQLVVRHRRWGSRKVAHRAHPLVELAQGNHEVLAPPMKVDQDRTRIAVLHCPFRSYAQFERKIVQGARAYADTTAELPEGAGHHWKRLYEMWEAGTLPDHWRQQIRFGPAGLLRAAARRDLTVDLRLRRALTSW